ncbi:hypothetical protein ACFV98_30225 [Streptomyces violascens]|uniref:hypothetical protein n=1 Tax=Streptomyces violascens TaxID=67381 RepID=UPI00364DD8B7
MNGIDTTTLDATIAKTFKEVKTAVDAHNEKSILMYSHALRALVDLRREIAAEGRAGN